MKSVRKLYLLFYSPEWKQNSKTIQANLLSKFLKIVQHEYILHLNRKQCFGEPYNVLLVFVLEICRALISIFDNDFLIAIILLLYIVAVVVGRIAISNHMCEWRHGIFSFLCEKNE